MTTNATEKIERWHADLPAVLRAAVEGLPIHQIIFDIGKRHGLTIEQLGFLAEEIARFVGGQTDAAGFLSSLQSALGGNRTQTAAVAREVNEKIFAKVREALLEASTAAPPPPTPRPSAPEAKAAPATPGKPEPLIIRPLPSPPREAADSEQRTPPQAVPSAAGQVAEREQPIASNVTVPAPATRTTFEQKPTALPVAKPLPSPASKLFEAVSSRTLEKPTPPKPAAIEPAAPIISPLGTRPPQEKREIKKEEPKQQDSETLKQVPPIPAVPQSMPPTQGPYRPPPPAQAYERAREAFQRELASAAAGRPTAQPETKPVSGVSAPPAPLGTKEALQREIEKFRQTARDSGPRTPQQAVPPATGQIVVGAPNAPSPSPAVPKPLKLPTEKIPKPQAPERYDIDPYKEPPE